MDKLFTRHQAKGGKSQERDLKYDAMVTQVDQMTNPTDRIKGSPCSTIFGSIPCCSAAQQIELYLLLIKPHFNLPTFPTRDFLWQKNETLISGQH